MNGQPLTLLIATLDAEGGVVPVAEENVCTSHSVHQHVSDIVDQVAMVPGPSITCYVSTTLN